MKLTFLVVGRTDNPAIERLSAEYARRIGRFADFSVEEIPDVKNTKNLSAEEQKTREGREILGRIRGEDTVILLDERGKMFSSVEFAAYLQSRLNTGVRRIVFVVGGPYGFPQAVYERGDYLLSLSPMTFSHQMIRLFFTEQLYRAFTILNHLPYHHA